MNPQGIERLVYAVVHQAARDYMDALKYFQHGRTTKKGAVRWNAVIYDCETFFINELSYYNCDLDGLEILSALEQRTEKTERMENKIL